MRKSALEKLTELKRKKQEPQQMSIEDLFLLLLDGNRPKENRRALETQREFVYDPSRLKGYMGAAGSAKTSALCAAGWLRALLQPGSKGLVARANYNDLMDTTGLRMSEMLNRLPKGVLLDRDKSPPMKWYVQPVPTLAADGTVIDDTPSAITFMGLQDGLGSYVFNWAIVDEADEVTESRVHEVNTRLRNLGGNYAVMMAFNPPDVTHWLYTACTGMDHTGRKVKEPWIKLFVSKPKENVRNLPPNYYDLLTKSLPLDMQTRLVHGQWGVVFEGQPVYREFKTELHVRDMLPYDPYAPLFRFWDFGYRHPYCCVAQQTFEGRLLVLREIVAADLEIQPFAAQVKSKCEQWFHGAKEWHDYGDPAARQKKDTGSTLVELAKTGITMRWKISTIDEGLRTIRTWLERIIDGQPALQFDRAGCPMLIRALQGGYHTDDLGKPVKDGYYDHSADAYRYGVVNTLGSVDHKTLLNLPSSISYDAANDLNWRR